MTQSQKVGEDSYLLDANSSFTNYTFCQLGQVLKFINKPNEDEERTQPHTTTPLPNISRASGTVRVPLIHSHRDPCVRLSFKSMFYKSIN